MWYKQVLAQVGGGVNFSAQEKTDSPQASEIDKIRDVDGMPAGLYDELTNILEKMGKTVEDYYNMNQQQQKEIWDLLVYRPHKMTMDDNGNTTSTEARRHSPYHSNPEETTTQAQLEQLRLENNNREPQSMASTEKGNSFQHFKNGEGYTQAMTGKQDPKLFGQLSSTQTWF